MRFLNIKSRAEWTYMSFVVMLLAVVSPGWTQNEQDSHQELLKKLFSAPPTGRSGIYRFLSPSAGWNPPGPRFIPIVGLYDPNAVPFLVNVLQNGPGWSDDELSKAEPADVFRYVARCYAALCLGSIGDSQAFDPLLAVLNDTSLGPYKYYSSYASREVEYNLRAHAAFALGCLGDRRAVTPLIKSLRQDGFVECIYALARLQAVTAVPVIVQVASDRNLFCGDVNHSLEYILKVNFTLRTAGKDHRYQVIDQFPEVGTVHVRDAYRTLWQHWIKAGDKYAREQFKEYYPQLKAALRDKPNAPSLHRELQRRMLRGGVAAVPYVIAEIEKGDTSLVPIASQLTKPRAHRIKDPSPQLSENATQIEALQWWKKNKQKWIIFQPTRPIEQGTGLPD